MGIIKEVKQLFETAYQREARLVSEHRARLAEEMRKARSEGWVTLAECSRVAGIPATEKDAEGRAVAGPSVEQFANRGQIESRRILTNFGDVILVREDAGGKIARSRSAWATLKIEDQMGRVSGPDVPAPPPPIVVQPSPQVKEDAGRWHSWNMFPKE
jgi:hypothetical protein